MTEPAQKGRRRWDRLVFERSFTPADAGRVAAELARRREFYIASPGPEGDVSIAASCILPNPAELNATDRTRTTTQNEKENLMSGDRLNDVSDRNEANDPWAAVMEREIKKLDAIVANEAPCKNCGRRPLLFGSADTTQRN